MVRNAVFGFKCSKNDIFYRYWQPFTKPSRSVSPETGADDRKASIN